MMSESLVRLHFLVLLLCCVCPSSFSKLLNNCRPDQIQAFTNFKNEFDTRQCNHSDDSNGVWCHKWTGAVIKLQLKACLSGTLKPNSSLFRFHQLRKLILEENNFISSSLPSEFGNLNKLEVLSLSSNGFIGQVPSSFANLSQLSVLNLYDNKLTGSFPLVRNLTKLSILVLTNNHFSGTLSPNIGLFELHHLRVLYLESNNFKSSLPSEFGNLNKLEELSLSSNVFFGQVPPQFGNLTSLNTLLLDQNMLTGSFPPVQNLTKLYDLNLAFNNFSGAIPSSILGMPFLTFLNLSENHFTGSIQVEGSTSSKLKNLGLGNNHFEGQILEPISKLTTLKYLDLSYLNTSYPIDLSLLCSLKFLVGLFLSGNNISPTSLSSNSCIPLDLQMLNLQSCGTKEFPNVIKKLKKLMFLILFDNKIKGKIPEWLWSLPQLTLVDLHYNFLNGFEGSVEAMVDSSVKVLDLGNNYFEGALPDLPLSIKVFSGFKNGFTGEIPLSICNRSSLGVIYLSYNNFSGSIPQCLSHFVNVRLRSNNLEGSIPDMFHEGTSLVTLDVGFNRISGKLPRSLQNCSALSFLNVENNKIEDTFPFWLKNLPNLNVLVLRSNKFHGPLSPPHQGPLGFPELRIFEVSNNKFTGSLPERFFVNWKASSSLTTDHEEALYMVHKEEPYAFVAPTIPDTIDLHYKGLFMEQAWVLTSYTTIDLSGNLFEGQIPESIGLLTSLIALNFSNNAFTSHIPLSLANLKELESLDLSRNQLSGTIPSGLKSLTFLAYIDVSHNHLMGEIPQGTQITGQSKSSFEGNSGLCGLPLENSCFSINAPSKQESKDEDEDSEEEQVLNWKAVAIGYGSGVLFGLAVAHVIATYKPEWLTKIRGLSKLGKF